MAEIRNVEQYEWLIYLFNGITLLFVGLIMISMLIGAPNTKRTLPTLISSLACIVMALYFFAETLFAKIKKRYTLDLTKLRI